MASKGFFFPGNVIRSNFEFHRITYIILYSLLKGCRAESINSPSSRMSMQHNARVKENTSSSSSSLRENSIFNRPSWACFNTPRYTSKILQPDYEAWIRPGFISWIFVSFRERNGTFEPVLFFSALGDFYWNLWNDLCREFLYSPSFCSSRISNVGRCVRTRIYKSDF